MPDVIPFDFDDRVVRVHQDDKGSPWFVAKDVCAVLEIGKYRDAVTRLDDDERGSVLVDTLGGKQEMSAVSESGLYALIFTSRKPEAKRFRKWVTGEVLPALRKYGTYSVPTPTPAPDALPEVRNLKANLRVSALHSAVQVAKMQGGDESEVDRLFAKYCAVLGPTHSARVATIPGMAELRDWADAYVVPGDYEIQSSHAYAEYCEWCTMDDDTTPVVSARRFGEFMRERYGYRKTNRVYYPVRVIPLTEDEPPLPDE